MPTQSVLNNQQSPGPNHKTLSSRSSATSTEMKRLSPTSSPVPNRTRSGSVSRRTPESPQIRKVLLSTKSSISPNQSPRISAGRRSQGYNSPRQSPATSPKRLPPSINIISSSEPNSETVSLASSSKLDSDIRGNLRSNGLMSRYVNQGFEPDEFGNQEVILDPSYLADFGLNLQCTVEDQDEKLSVVSNPPLQLSMAAKWTSQSGENIKKQVKLRTEYLPPTVSNLKWSSQRALNPSDVRDDSPRTRWTDLKGRPKGGQDGEAGEDEAFVDEMVVIERPIYSQKDFDQGFEGGQRPQKTASTWVKGKAGKCECSPSCIRKFFSSRLPFLGILRDYSLRRDLTADIIAGLTVGIMHIPQGMAYGQLSTLPPVYGLYVSFFPVILYFFLGTSKHVSIGTFAVISLMVGSAVDKGLQKQNIQPRSWNETIGTGDNATIVLMDNSEEMVQVKLKLAMAVTFAVGVLQTLLGVFRLGFLTVYLSDPLISGFTTGAACHVFTSQIKHIFGISMNRYSGAFKLIYSYRDIFVNLPQTNPVTFIASIVCMVLLYVIKEYINNNPKIKPHLKMPVPVELIVVALGTVISYFVKLEENYEVKIVGDVPVGIPEPNLNAFTYLTDMIASSFAIAIVAFAISVSMAKIFAKKHEYAIDSNQELLAYGLCNVASSFFSSFVSAASLSRSLIQENVGGRTQITGLVSSALLLVVLLVIGPYFKTLPNCILASIILVALKGMFRQFLELKRLWTISTIDFVVWLLTFCATVLLDVDWGLLVGVIFALLTVIIRSQRPYSCLLGQVPGTDIYKDISVYKAAEETANIKIFRFDSALFFANSEFFRSSLYKLTVDPNDLKKKQRKLDKKRRKEDKELLNITVDSAGSANVTEPESLVANIVEEEDIKVEEANDAVSNNIVAVLEGADSIRDSNEGDPDDSNVMKDLPTLTDVYFIILDCSTMSYIDSVGVKVLRQVVTELRAFNITVYLAQCKSGVREMFERTGFYQLGGKDILFVTIHDAVVSAQLHQWSITGENSPLTNGAIDNNNLNCVEEPENGQDSNDNNMPTGQTSESTGSANDGNGDSGSVAMDGVVTQEFNTSM